MLVVCWFPAKTSCPKPTRIGNGPLAKHAVHGYRKASSKPSRAAASLTGRLQVKFSHT